MHFIPPPPQLHLQPGPRPLPPTKKCFIFPIRITLITYVKFSNSALFSFKNLFAQNLVYKKVHVFEKYLLINHLIIYETIICKWFKMWFVTQNNGEQFLKTLSQRFSYHVSQYGSLFCFYFPILLVISDAPEALKSWSILKDWCMKLFQYNYWLFTYMVQSISTWDLR